MSNLLGRNDFRFHLYMSGKHMSIAEEAKYFSILELYKLCARNGRLMSFLYRSGYFQELFSCMYLCRLEVIYIFGRGDHHKMKSLLGHTSTLEYILYGHPSELVA